MNKQNLLEEIKNDITNNKISYKTCMYDTTKVEYRTRYKTLEELLELINQLEPTISEVKEYCIVKGCDYCTFKNDCQAALMCPQGWYTEAITKAIRGEK